MAGTPKETNFEQFFTNYMVEQNGYHQVESSEYDKELCVIKSELETFLRESQPIEWAKFVKNSGGVDNARRSLYARLKTELGKGTLSAIRDKKNFEAGNGSAFKLLYFQPASHNAEEHMRGYNANRFAVVRQLHYTKNRHKFQQDLVIDMAVFINGLPMLTIELKNSLTGQNHLNAIRQYMKDRPVQGEPLLEFKRCLVHFAMGTEQVYMTTKLNGQNTRFFPFNTSYMNENLHVAGYRTSYMWEDVLTKDSLLDLLQNFIEVQINEETTYNTSTNAYEISKSENLIFPRWHQRRAVHRLIQHTLEEGVGHRYLIQHSAGSGKSNTIVWLAFRLATLHRNLMSAAGMFDSVIVVTDRRVLDRQLQDNIQQFALTPDQVVCIDERKGMHSQELKDAIENRAKIIVTTLQKFSVIADTIELFPNRHYAVIIDEAHSSQTGEAARNMRKSLSLQEAADFDAEDEAKAEEMEYAGIPSLEDSLNNIMQSEAERKGLKHNVSFYAFTATPKPKTIELFCERRNGIKEPFDVYSMEDAIREGFILDVLESYTSFSRYYRLMHRTGVPDKMYQERKAVRVLSNYVDLQDSAIERKSRIMLEHFASQTDSEIQGKARAMVVTRSRLHAVRYKRKFDEIMQEMHLPYGCLVAFSGSVHDGETGEDYTETSMNNLQGVTDIALAFKNPKYRILIVANKYQTGFDEPMLQTMFVDKKLGGTSTVQTLSRLNRTMKGKAGTMVLDFVNDPQDIQEQFQKYYGKNFMLQENETDPNSLYDLKSRIDDYHAFTEQDVDEFIQYYSDPKGDPQLVYGPLNRVCDYIKQNFDTDIHDSLRKVCRQYVNIYRFLCQIIPFADATLEKYHCFLAALIKMLPYNPDTLPYDVLQEAELESYKLQFEFTKSLSLQSDDTAMEGMKPADANKKEEDKEEWLSKIIKTLNDTFGLNLSDEDKIELIKLQDKVSHNEELLGYFNPNNSRDDVRDKFFDTVDAEMLEFINTKIELYNKLTDDHVSQLLKSTWFNEMYDKHVRGLNH